MPPKTEAPQDTPYPGLLKVQVDATDLDRHIFRVHETIPVAKAGPMTILYPQWLPGNHAAQRPDEEHRRRGRSAPAARSIPWMRDPVDVFAFHIDVAGRRDQHRRRLRPALRRAPATRAASS